MLLLQIGLLVSVFYFVNTFNLLTVWYTAGIYLILLGLWLFLDDGDIFVGFLWVIDLGVGLIFFIFVLHYSTFAHQKSRINKIITCILGYFIHFTRFSQQTLIYEHNCKLTLLKNQWCVLFSDELVLKLEEDISIVKKHIHFLL